MNDRMIESVVTVATAIIGLAIVAVLVSNQAQTGNVIKSAGSALAGDIAAAVSPITGGSGGFTGLGSPMGTFPNQY
jgi:hypothetical protein